MNEPDLVPLWAAVSQKPIPESPALLEQVIANTTSKPDKPTDIRKRRLLLKDPGSYEAMTNWLKYIKEEWVPVSQELGFLPNSDQERTAIFMLMGFVTQDTRHIAMVTNWPVTRKWLQERRERARKYRIWVGNGSLMADWFDLAEKQDGSAEVAFMMDVLVINGDAHKTRDKRYSLTEKGKNSFAGLR